MNLKQAGRAAIVVGVACGAGLASAGAATAAAAAAATAAWGTTSSAPAGTLGQLYGVAAAASDALAVGAYNPGQPPTAVPVKPYAEHWNGTGWTATSVPLASVYSQQDAQLNGVAEVAPGDGWAVGTVADFSSLASQTLAYHWDGTAWQRSLTPNPAQSNQLNAVAARATNDVWAVGGDGGYPEASLVLHWNGTAWARVKVPNIGSLHAVTVAPGNVWVASGDAVERLNGTAWASLPAPPGGGSVSIAGLADAASGLWAVGYRAFTCGEGGTCTTSYAALWNGTTWAVVPAGGGNGLSGVVAAGSTVLAAGGTGVWQLSSTGASPQLTPALTGQLTAIAADPAGNPWAVGWTDNGGTISPAIINAPGIGQGGIIVTTGAAGATVTWTGPATGTGSTDPSGQFGTGGLPDGSYTVIASLAGCQPGIASAVVTAGNATAVNAHITCPP
jgi:hypothetical protein